MGRRFRQRLGERVSAPAWRPEDGDAALYGLAALFALLAVVFSTIPLYRQWAELAVGPYVAAALASLAIGWVRRRRRAARTEAAGAVAVPVQRAGPGRPRTWPRSARSWVFLGVLVGATLVPLALEVAWRSDGNPAAHVQPEVTVVEQAGDRAAKGEDPYRTVVGANGHLVHTNPGQPAYESFFPYLPLMIVFGLPSSAKDAPQLSDPRIFFSLATLLVAAAALVISRGGREAKVRTLQVLAVLPTAALPLATGGDDMPVVALLLLAMVLAQRRRPTASGVVLGIAAAMKFTAWPLAALALFAARDRDGVRRPGRMALGMLLVGGAVVVPFILQGPHAFVENVVLFPLGLSGVASPAASPLPGHLLVTAFPSLHRVVPATAAALGAVVLGRQLWRRPPVNAAQVSVLAGWVMLAAILVAPATRIGYLLYPINFFVWGRVLRDRPEDLVAMAVPEPRHHPELVAGITPDRGAAAAGSRTA